MCTINNVGFTCKTRDNARLMAALVEGKVIDMAKRDPGFVEGQILCAKYGIPNHSARWIVLHNRFLSQVKPRNILEATRHAVNQVTYLDGVRVMSKKTRLSMAAAKIRFSKI